MRLGVVGLVPGDPRAITGEQLRRVAALGVSAACFHASGAVLAEVTSGDLRACRQRYRDVGLELAQLGLGYGECLFDPDPAVRAAIQRTIVRGLAVAGELDAGVMLMRTGSLSPTGPYNPSPRNHEPGRLELLIDELRRVAAAAESAGVEVVIETHLGGGAGDRVARRVLRRQGSRPDRASPPGCVAGHPFHGFDRQRGAQRHRRGTVGHRRQGGRHAGAPPARRALPRPHQGVRETWPATASRHAPTTPANWSSAASRRCARSRSSPAGSAWSPPAR